MPVRITGTDMHPEQLTQNLHFFEASQPCSDADVVRTHYAYRLYGLCGKLGWLLQSGCCGETTAGLNPDLVVSALSIL